MATAKVTFKEKPIESVTLTLNAQEAELVFAVVGKIVGGDEQIRSTASAIYGALLDAEVPRNEGHRLVVEPELLNDYDRAARKYYFGDRDVIRLKRVS